MSPKIVDISFYLIYYNFNWIRDKKINLSNCGRKANILKVFFKTTTFDIYSLTKFCRNVNTKLKKNLKEFKRIELNYKVFKRILLRECIELYSLFFYSITIKYDLNLS